MDTIGSCGDLTTQAELLVEAGRHTEALLLLSVAQRSHPENVALLKLTGRVFIAQGRIELAIGALLAAAEIDPVDAKLHYALSILLLGAGRVHGALAHAIQSFEQAPTAEHATILGAVLMDLGRYEEALGLSDHAIELDSNHWEAINNRAGALQGLGRFEDAIVAGQRAVEVVPTNALVRFNLGCALLKMGRMTGRAWDLFESRLDLPGNPPWTGASVAWRWNGEDIADQTILLHTEQGFGDTIQFIRYLPLVAGRARRVILAVQPALLNLVRDVMGIDYAVATGAPFPPHDVMAPLLSLPRLFGTTVDTIPPLLPWPGMRPATPKPEHPRKVGLAWRGSRTFRDDRQRSIPVAELARLAGIPGLLFVSLQKHEADRNELPRELEIIDPMVNVIGFDDTAAIITGLDLVITVDTAVAHLAATMGRPVWLLTRWRGCWRWIHGQSDSPWYPAMRIFRQLQPNDWSETLDALQAQLVAWSLHET